MRAAAERAPLGGDAWPALVVVCAQVWALARCGPARALQMYAQMLYLAVRAAGLPLWHPLERDALCAVCAVSLAVACAPRAL